MIELTPELQAAAAPLATPVVPTPTVPQVSAAFQTNNPVSPAGPVVPLGTSTSAPAPAAAQPAVPAPTKPTSFGAKLHEALMKNPLHPGGVLPSVLIAGIDALGGVTNALSNVAASPDSGMGVLTQTAQNIEAQKAAKAQAVAAEQQQVAAAKQKAFENQLKMQNSATDKQKADAAMMDAHAKFITSMRVDNDSSSAHNAAMAKNSESFVKPILDSGGEILYPSVSEAELHSQEFLNTLPQDPKHGGPDYTQFMPVFTGTSPILNSDGTPKLSDAGVPMFQRNFEIVKLGKPVTLDESHAAFLNKNSPSGQPFQVGQVLPAQLYTREWQAAHVAQGVDLNVAKTQSETQKNMSESEKAKADATLARQTSAQKAQNLRTGNLFAPYLAMAHGDPVIGFDLMKRSKDAGALTAVEQMYGPGVLEKTRQTNLTQLTATIRDNENQLNNPVTSATLSPEDKTELQNELKAARVQRNEYLGLHPNDPDQVAQSVLKLDQVDPAKRGATILGSTTMPNTAKVYLLRHYNLPVPPALLPKPAAQPTPVPVQ